MSSNKSFFFLIIFSLLLLSDHFQVSSSCPSKCGRIHIPFPFGIGKDCYLNEWYAIECTTVNNSVSGKPVPILSVLKKEVVSIHFSQASGYIRPRDAYPSIRIKNQIVSKGCSNDGRDKIESYMNLTGTPFYFDETNSLIAVGCNIIASLTHVEPSMVGCKSSCSITYQTPTNLLAAQFFATTKCYYENDYFYDYCTVISSVNKTRCNGVGCCQADIPAGFQQIVGVKIDNATITGGCNVAFLTDKPISSNGADSHRLYGKNHSTISLGWFIQKTDSSFEDSLGCINVTEYKRIENYGISCVCDYNVYQNYSTCACAKGYEGNPYLQGGCKDINECQTSEYNLCSSGTKCVNLQGHYKCLSNRPLIIGLSASFGSLIFVGGIYLLFIFIKKQRMLRKKKKFFKRNGGLLLQQQLSSTEGHVEKTKVFKSGELEKATENFSLNRILGQGGQGTVYKGMLVDGRIVAVKKSKVVDEDKLEEFINEVVILSQINHRNIVKLLGCCLETEVPILVYEFISNGNLFEHLHDESDDNTMVTWEIRLRIAVDIAGALSYLHSSASSPIYHRDIKSTNIMLDEKYRAKVADFGTSRSVTVDHTHLTTVVSGTVGYVDPEYFQSSQFTDKSDVYSFGVVLVELITGEKSISYLRSQENRTLSTYFLQVMKEKRLFDIIDSRIRDGCKLNQVIATAKIARKCLNLKGRKRPSMREVSMELEKIQSSHGDMQQHEYVSEEEEEKDEEIVKVNIGMESSNHVVVTAPASQQNIVDASSSSWSDVQPLVPLYTW